MQNQLKKILHSTPSVRAVMQQSNLGVTILATIAMLSFVSSAVAINLNQAYQKAMTHSYFLKSKSSERDALKSAAGVPLSMWLPQLSAHGFLNTGHFDVDGANRNVQFNGLDVMAHQTIFSYAKIAEAMGSKYTRALADIRYGLEKQALTKKVVDSYFDVLLAKHLLELSEFNQKVVKLGLHQIKVAKDLQFKTPDEVAYIESDYDDAIAEKLKARALYSDAIAQFEHVINGHVNKIQSLRTDVLAKMPPPPSLAVWEQRARMHNLDIRALQLAIVLARLDARKERSGFLPKVDAYAGYDWLRNRGAIINNGQVLGPSSADATRMHGYVVGVQASLPLFSGGATFNKVNAAAHTVSRLQYALAEAQSDIALKTRNDYLMLITAREQVKAEKQAVAANQLAVKLYQLGVKEHTKTNFDLMKMRAKLGISKEKYLKALFDYMKRYVDLHADAGQLNRFVIIELNQYLDRHQALHISQIERYPVADY